MNESVSQKLALPLPSSSPRCSGDSPAVPGVLPRSCSVGRGELRDGSNKATTVSRTTSERDTTMDCGWLEPPELSLLHVRGTAVAGPPPLYCVWLGHPRQGDAVATGNGNHFPLSS